MADQSETRGRIVLERGSQKLDSRYSKTTHVELRGVSRLPPPNYGDFLASCLTMFQEEVVRDFQEYGVRTIDDIIELYIREFVKRQKDEATARTYLQNGSKLIKTDAELEYTNHLKQSREKKIKTRVVPIYEHTFPLDDHLTESTREYVEGIDHALDQQIPNRKGFLPRRSFTDCLSQMVGLTSTLIASAMPYLGYYHITLDQGSEMRFDPSLMKKGKEREGVPGIPRIIISYVELERSRRFAERILTLSEGIARRFYRDLEIVGTEEKTGSCVDFH